MSVIAINLTLFSHSCIAKDIKGNGNLVTETKTISDFNKIEIETDVDVNYSQEKNTGKLDFTIDKNLLDYYDIYSKDNVLHIKLKEQYRKNIKLQPTKSEITISSDYLNEIEVAGSSKFVFCTPFTSDKLHIEIAGSGKVFANKFPVKINECIIELAGSGEFLLLGSIQKAKLEFAGSGQVSALDCTIAQLSVDLAGSGHVKAHVTETLDVEIAGSGSVFYKGNPTINTDISGSGKVKKL